MGVKVCAEAVMVTACVQKQMETSDTVVALGLASSSTFSQDLALQGMPFNAESDVVVFVHVC